MSDEMTNSFEPSIDQIRDHRAENGFGLHEARRDLYKQNLLAEVQEAREWGDWQRLAVVLEAVIAKLL